MKTSWVGGSPIPTIQQSVMKKIIPFPKRENEEIFLPPKYVAAITLLIIV